MLHQKISALYFSATGTTEKIVTSIADRLSERLGGTVPTHPVNFTPPAGRERIISFSSDDIVIAGVPVIAGRVPNVLLKFLKTIGGSGALAVGVVVYGNRNYDDALIEFCDILASDGFNVIAGAAFIGEHSFSRILAKDRPDERDMAVVRDFADRVYQKICGPDKMKAAAVGGNRPYRDYYRPKDKDGQPFDFRKIIPSTNEDCITCKLCASVCPMGSIDAEDTSRIIGICMKCCACVKKCPVGAKVFDDERYLRHKEEIEAAFAGRREPELFV